MVTFAKKRILICDDDPDILGFLELLLQHDGYDAVIASGHAEMQEHLRRGNPDLILMDIRMPEWDGFDIAENLRRSGLLTPIIFVSAHDNTFCRIYAQTLGAVGYFPKPIDAELLLLRIKDTLAPPVCARAASPA